VSRIEEEAPWDQTLSGGEKQRLAFARILLHRPDIIVLDEATSALDPQSQDKLMELLTGELAATTIVSVGHRPELEAFHSRKIVLERRRGGARFVTDINLIPQAGPQASAQALARPSARAGAQTEYGVRRPGPRLMLVGFGLNGSPPFFDAA
jgi:putative ATP-binding cassette transporter